MGLRYLLITLVILTSSGCAASNKNIKPDKSKVMAAYLDAVSSGRFDAVNYIKDNLKLNKTFGYVKPYVPVVEPAVVRMVWIPAHKSKDAPDALVGGHWVYVMVKQSQWFIDTQEENKAKIPIIIPYKENSGKK